MTRKPRTNENSPVSKALRKAGFVPVPRYWVTPDQLDVIKRMAEGNGHVVNEIRAAHGADRLMWKSE